MSLSTAQHARRPRHLAAHPQPWRSVSPAQNSQAQNSQAQNSPARSLCPRPLSPWLSGLSLLLVVTLAVSAGAPLAPLMSQLSTGPRVSLADQQLLTVLTLRTVRRAQRQAERPLPPSLASARSLVRFASDTAFAPKRAAPNQVVSHLLAGRLLLAHLALPPPALA